MVFRCKKNVDPGIKVHPSIFGHFKNEVPEGQRIKIFVTMGSKNYSYDLEDIATQEITGRVTKIGGLTLSGPALKTMDTNKMLEFVQKIQENECVEESVPQFRMKINNVSKIISATEVRKLYSNLSNEKCYYSAAANSSKLWAYGTTSYQTL